jgi:2-polyprenyl-3-methyl-5-hydroxy-6-metoxy-1,4-benzoquinol methylase
MEYYIKNKIINDTEFFFKGVRDDDSINVFKDNKTGALVLDKIKEQNYESKGLNYWNSTNITEARNKTYDDDIRRYNQINNINYTTLLDFGCGNGGLLKYIKDNNKDKNVFGMELNENLIDYLNSENIPTYNNINKIPDNLDCIMLNHVLEHLYDPIDTLKCIKQKMKENTLLIIEVPHAKDFLISEYNCNEFNKFTFWSEHLILHTKESLLNLLNIIGFTHINITYYQRYNIFNHLNWLSNGKPGGHKKTKYHDETLIDSYNNFLIKNEKTDTLIAHCYI